MIKLSILICGTPLRISNGFSKKIIESLDSQIGKLPVEIIYFVDNKKRSVGEKRNDLISLANGEYIVFVDDDDRVSDDYVITILQSIKKQTDVVLFGVECSVNGGKYKFVDYDARHKKDKNTANSYLRIPNHIMCWKKELADKEKFPEKNFAEDSAWAIKMKKHIKTQSKTNKVLYYYDFSNAISETQ